MWRLAILVLSLLMGASRVAWADDHAAPASGEHDPIPKPVDFGVYVPGAQALEGRIIAPCCFTQTIDVHGSPMSMELRREIRERLQAGETSEVIERSFVARFGARVLVEPSGGPLEKVGIVLSLGVLGLGAMGYRMLRRWRRAAASRSATSKEERRVTEASAGNPDRARLDARLDSELSALGGDDG